MIINIRLFECEEICCPRFITEDNIQNGEESMRKQPLPEKICLPGSCLPWLASKIHSIYFGLELIPWRGSSSVVVADQTPALANPRSMGPPSARERGQFGPIRH
jgi:hypothetical protein